MSDICTSSSSIGSIVDGIKANVDRDLTVYYENATSTSTKFNVLKSGLEAENFVCGDINVEDFQNLLQLIEVHTGDVFYDLGCGSGNCLMACYFYPVKGAFSKVIGIELMKSKLIECSFVIKHLKAIQNPTQNCLIDTMDANFLEADWSDGNIVYACATCFTSTLLSQLFEVFRRLRRGSRIIILDKTIPESLCSGEERVFELRHQVRCRTTWGSGVAYTYIVV